MDQKERRQIEHTVAMVRELTELETGARVGVDISLVDPDVFDSLDGEVRREDAYTPVKTVFADGRGNYVHVYRAAPYDRDGARRIEKGVA
jgi:hypothetical protein